MKKFAFRFGSLILGASIFSQTTSLAQINKESDPNYQKIVKNIDSKFNPNEYILGIGDRISIIFDEFQDLGAGSSLSAKNLLIGPDGHISLSRIGNIDADGKTIDQLKNIIEEEYSAFLLKKPVIRIFVELYRPVTVYVTGEVTKEGYYILPGTTFSEGGSFGTINTFKDEEFELDSENTVYTFPTLFDAIKAAEGVTLYSDLSNVKVTRKVPEVDGGGLIQTKLNLESLLANGDLSNNINLRDGDVIEVSKSANKQLSLFYQASNSNLNPEDISVFVSGQVETGGKLKVPSGSPLNVAINITGKQLLSGNIEFFRFNKDGSFERRIFRYKPNAKIDSYSNPILMNNDYIRVKNSLFTTTTEVLGTITAPVITTFGVKQLFED